MHLPFGFQRLRGEEVASSITQDHHGGCLAKLKTATLQGLVPLVGDGSDEGVRFRKLLSWSRQGKQRN